MKNQKILTSIIIIYFTIGLIFSTIYAIFYHWSALSFFSPGFYVVLLSWPVQVPGFIYDFQYYGFAGKVLY